jgi:phytoene synthase
VEAIMSDTGSVRIGSRDSLIRFAYGAASTVGLMMCAVMGVRDPIALPFAVDLGIAMQLTNIARDVVEDAERDRIYLPDELLGSAIHPDQILTAEEGVQRRVKEARNRIIDCAARYYRSADKGMRFIPFRARLAVITAARLYEAIGKRIQANPPPWGGRAFVGSAGKTRQTLAAVGCVLFHPAYWQGGRPPVHDPSLHEALAGLPGVDGGA